MSSPLAAPNAQQRLDRLPISRFHKITLVAVSFAYFFEFADINTFAVTAPRLITLWGVTVNQVAYVTSTSFVGMFLGSIIAGALADRVGRKKALTATTVFFGLFSLVSVFSWDVVSLGVFRFLTSAGLAAMTVVAVIYLSELFPAANRGKYQAYAIAIGICGTPATSFIASALVPAADWTWRLVYLWGALGLVFVFFRPGHFTVPLAGPLFSPNAAWASKSARRDGTLSPLRAEHRSLGVNGEGQSTMVGIVSADPRPDFAFLVTWLTAGSTAASRDSEERLLHRS